MLAVVALALLVAAAIFAAVTRGWSIALLAAGLAFWLVATGAGIIP